MIVLTSNLFILLFSIVILINLIIIVCYYLVILLEMETININQNKEFYKNIIDDTNENLFDNVFDVAIIGGGFAGLSAALLLGRYLRSTIIFDVKETRKSLIHGYLGFEKTPREELLKKSWQDVLQYNSIKRVENKVEKIEKDIDSNLFIISTVPPEYENYEKDKNNV